MATPVLISQVDIYATLQTFQFCDVYDEATPGYLQALTTPLALTRTLPDMLVGIQADRSAQVEISNVNSGLYLDGSAYGENPDGTDSGYGDQLYGGMGHPTIAEITAAEDLHGKRARTRVRDITNGVDIFTVEGTIHLVEMDALKASIALVSRDLEAFEERLPKRRILDVYANADLANTRDHEAPVNVPFGVMRKVTLVLVQSVATVSYDYGAFRKPATASLVLNTIYRDGRVVGAAEYSLVESPTSYYVVRFTRAQTDVTGRPMVIQADVTVTELTNPADAIKFLLSDATYGLGKLVNTASFTTAASNYTTLGISVTGGLATRTRAFDILNLLLLHGAVLDKNSSGEYTITVDMSALHTAASLSLGAGDRYFNNVNLETARVSGIALEDQPKELLLNGLWDPGFPVNGSQGAFLLKARRTQDNRLGKIEEVFNPFLGDTSSLDRQAYYLWHRMIRLNKLYSGEAQLAAKDLGLNQLVSLSIPALAIKETGLEIRTLGFRSSYDGQGNVEASIPFVLSPYSAAIFTYVAESVKAAPSASYLTDYVFTPPTAPTGFSVTSTAVRLGSNGSVEAVFNVQATAPSVNVSHLVFMLKKGAATFPVQQVVLAIAASGVGTAALIAIPGLVYDLECFARNVSNNPGFQDGTVAQILAQTAPGDTTLPADVTGVAAVAGTGKSISVTWTAITGDGTLAGYVVYRGVSANPTTEVDRPDTTRYVDENVAYGTTYHYRIKARDFTGNLSANYSANVSALVGRIVTDDVGNDQVTTPKRQVVNSQALSFGSIDASSHSHLENTAVLYTQNATTGVINAGLIARSVVVSFAHGLSKIPIVTIVGGTVGFIYDIESVSTTDIVGRATNLKDVASTSSATIYYW